jgi:hypothetical protein
LYLPARAQVQVRKCRQRQTQSHFPTQIELRALYRFGIGDIVEKLQQW